ncbi:MAG: cytochrome P450 [Chloroflexi bacterium]|nr:cytochrome P450 [Chloroflexota bacterium]
MNSLGRAFSAVVRPLAMRALLARERIESGVAYNPLSPGLRADPYSVYEELRRKDPVHRMRLQDAWVLTDYADVDMVLRDSQRFGNAGREFGYIPQVSMLDLDPPEHTKIRALVSHGFTPRSVAALEPRIREMVDSLLSKVKGKERFDLIADLAFPLPVIVIAEMLGVPPEDREQFNEWSNTVSLIVDPLLDERQVSQVQQAVDEVFTYFEGVAEERRRDPKDDLVSALVTAEVDGERLERDDLLVNLLLVLVAGNETTRNLIGNGTLALLHNPGELQRLRDDPALVTGAVDELLRFDSPVQLDSRIARESIELRGKQIAPGQRVICLLGAANRDPQAFTDPERLDVSRSAANHLAFGRGIHYCLGSPLARLEGRVAFEALVPRLGNLRLAEEPRYRNQVTLRGLESLWLEKV